MTGIFTYASFLAIYYLALVILDIVGSVLEYRKSILSQQVENPHSVKFKVDFNSDIAVAALIYLISYYSGVFDG
jgi:multisubunit Na+/H+ antiporter MnhE subunit